MRLPLDGYSTKPPGGILLLDMCFERPHGCSLQRFVQHLEPGLHRVEWPYDSPREQPEPERVRNSTPQPLLTQCYNLPAMVAQLHMVESETINKSGHWRLLEEEQVRLVLLLMLPVAARHLDKDHASGAQAGRHGREETDRIGHVLQHM